MNAFRKCCGYYCAFIMFIGIFFYVITIILEVTHNNFMLGHLQEVELEKDHLYRWSTKYYDGSVPNLSKESV